MIELLHPSFQLIYSEPPARATDISRFRRFFERDIPEYFQFSQESDEIAIGHTSGRDFRLWGPGEAIEEYDSSNFHRWMPNAIPIGDDGGPEVIFYLPGKQGFGLYHVEWGVLDAEDAIWIAPSLTDFLTRATGVETFDDMSEESDPAL